MTGQLREQAVFLFELLSIYNLPVKHGPGVGIME